MQTIGSIARMNKQKLGKRIASAIDPRISIIEFMSVSSLTTEYIIAECRPVANGTLVLLAECGVLDALCLDLKLAQSWLLGD